MNTAISQPDGRLALSEANHRFLNTLAALGGLLRRDFARFEDPAIREAVAVYSKRIHAFACVHRTLGVDSAGELVDAAAHLADLCAQLCEAQLAPRGLHCEFKSDPCVLLPETCQKLSLIVVELVTNAAKHAFVERAQGRVSVCLRRTPGAWICLVADNGSGFRNAAAAGHGLSLVRGLAQALGGELSVYSGAGGAITTLAWPD